VPIALLFFVGLSVLACSVWCVTSAMIQGSVMGTVHLLPDGVVLLFLAPPPFFVALPALFFMASLNMLLFFLPTVKSSSLRHQYSSSSSSPSQHACFQSPGLCQLLSLGCALLFFWAVPRSSFWLCLLHLAPWLPTFSSSQTCQIPSR